MSEQLHGRDLHEAVERAMAPIPLRVATTPHGVRLPVYGDYHGPTEREMKNWLHKRGRVVTETVDGHADARLWWAPETGRATSEHAFGNDEREALGRLVLVVYQREKAK